MKTPNLHYRRLNCLRGMSLVELSVVIAALLMMVSLLLFGAAAWKSAAERTTCLGNLRAVQVAMRSYQNLYQKADGQDFDPAMVVGNDLFILTPPKCPSDGSYTYSPVFPAPGTLVMRCDIEKHVPDNASGW